MPLCIMSVFVKHLGEKLVFKVLYKLGNKPKI